MRQALKFKKAGGHIPVFEHIHKIPPVVKVFAKAVLGIPLGEEVVAVLPHMLSTALLDQGDGPWLRLQSK
eukprot:3446193-Prorocentrum_lima.AAC.1